MKVTNTKRQLEVTGLLKVNGRKEEKAKVQVNVTERKDEEGKEIEDNKGRHRRGRKINEAQRQEVNEGIMMK